MRKAEHIRPHLGEEGERGCEAVRGCRSCDGGKCGAHYHSYEEHVSEGDERGVWDGDERGIKQSECIQRWKQSERCNRRVWCGVASPEQETVESALAPSTASDAQVTDVVLPV